MEALTRLRDNQVDLILSDINMPNRDGEELIRQVKMDKVFRDIPIFMITTDDSTTRVLRLRQPLGHTYHRPFISTTARSRCASP